MAEREGGCEGRATWLRSKRVYTECRRRAARSPDLLTTALPEVQLPYRHHVMLRRKQVGGWESSPGAQLAKGRAGAGAPKDKQRGG